MDTFDCGSDLTMTIAARTAEPAQTESDHPIPLTATPGERSAVPRDLLAPREAAVALQPDFRALARLLSRRDRSTRDDLVQEMSLAALECAESHTRSFFLRLGFSRALNYLRWWNKQTGITEGADGKRL